MAKYNYIAAAGIFFIMSSSASFALCTLFGGDRPREGHGFHLKDNYHVRYIDGILRGSFASFNAVKDRPSFEPTFVHVRNNCEAAIFSGINGAPVAVRTKKDAKLKDLSDKFPGNVVAVTCTC